MAQDKILITKRVCVCVLNYKGFPETNIISRIVLKQERFLYDWSWTIHLLGSREF